MVRVTAEHGSWGLGEAYWEAGVLEPIEAASECIIGKDPFGVASLIFGLLRCLSGENSRASATVTATSRIELSRWDFIAGALDTPTLDSFRKSLG